MKFRLKKLLCFAFALLMLLSAIPAAAVGGSARSSSYPDVQFPTVDYTDLGDAYAVRRAQPGTHQEMTIPDTHSGKPVTTLATGCLCTAYDLIDYGNFNDGTPSYGYYYYPCTYYLPASITTVENEIVAGGNDITLVFQGAAPSFADNAFYNVSKVTVRYPSSTSPCGVSGWTEVAGNSYGADQITWIDYTLDHNFKDGTCTVCGKSEEQKECDHDYFGSTICNNCGEPCPHSSYILSWQVQPTCTGEGTSLYHCSTCGDPKTVTAPATGHSFVDGTCTACGEAEPNYAQLTGTMLLPCENVKVWLFVSGEDTPAYTAQISGEQYCFTGVTPGGYTLKVSCDGGVPREYPVTLTPGENTQDVTLSRPGDVDGDRDLTVVDVSMVYAHVRGTQTLEGYSLQCADLNGDGQVDIVDTAIAYSMTRE